jgi:hypothetical protein
MPDINLFAFDFALQDFYYFIFCVLDRSDRTTQKARRPIHFHHIRCNDNLGVFHNAQDSLLVVLKETRHKKSTAQND